MPTSLGRRAGRGARVTAFSTVAQVGSQAAGLLLLSRLLEPVDFGRMAIVVSVVGFAEVVRDFGLSSAAIQAPELSDAQRDLLFWINTLVGLSLTVVVVAASPLFAAVFGDRALRPMLIAVSPVFLVNGLATQYRASLNRDMRFGALAMAQGVPPVVGIGAAIAYASLFGGYWALVIQQITISCLALVILLASGRWLPGKPLRGTPLKGLITYGTNLMGAQLISYVGNNVDNVVLGMRTSVTQVGFYSRAFQTSVSPLMLMRVPTTTVALPVLSRLTGDRSRYSEALVTGQVILGYGLGAIAVALAGAAAPAVDVVLGSQWGAVAPILRILGWAALFQLVSYVAYWAYLSVGEMRSFRARTSALTGIRVVSILVGSFWGPIGVAVGYTAAVAVGVPVQLHGLSRLRGIDSGRLVAGTWRICLVAVLAFAVTWLCSALLSDLGAVGRLAACGSVCATVYASSLTLVPILRGDGRRLVRACRLVLHI